MVTKQQIAEGYDKIAEKIYVSDDFYSEVMAIEKNWHGDILDAGCGQAPVLRKLQDEKFKNLKIERLVGVDISDKLLEMARRRVPEAEIIKADIDNLPFADNSFDFAVMVDVFQYLLDQSTHDGECSAEHSSRDDGCSGFDRALEEVKRVLKPGGKFVVTVPNKNWILFDSYIKRRKNIQPVEDHFFTFDEMAELLKKHNFQIADYRGADCFRYYAPYHKYEMWLAHLFTGWHKKMKKIIFKAIKE